MQTTSDVGCNDVNNGFVNNNKKSLEKKTATETNLVPRRMLIFGDRRLHRR
jgi:hypothetical protein